MLPIFFHFPPSPTTDPGLLLKSSSKIKIGWPACRKRNSRSKAWQQASKKWASQLEKKPAIGKEISESRLLRRTSPKITQLESQIRRNSVLSKEWENECEVNGCKSYNVSFPHSLPSTNQYMPIPQKHSKAIWFVAPRMPFLAFGVAALPEQHCTLWIKTFAFKEGFGQWWLGISYSLFLAGLSCWGSRSSMFKHHCFPTLLSATKNSYIEFQCMQRNFWAFAALCHGQIMVYHQRKFRWETSELRSFKNAITAQFNNSSLE